MPETEDQVPHTDAAVEAALRRRHRPAYARRTAASHAAFFLPYLRPGVSLLDLGCGPGSITAGLAAAVHPAPTIGVDLDPSQATYLDGLENVTVVGADIRDLPFENGSFDAIFAHHVLQHLPDPLAAVREARRVARPGAVIGIGDADWDGQLLAPPDPLLDRGFELMARFREGTSPRVGKHLRGLLAQAGFARCVGQASVLVEGTTEAVRHFAIVQAGFFSNRAFVTKAVERGWAGPEEMAEISEAWLAWGADPGAYLARFGCQAVGWAD